MPVDPAYLTALGLPLEGAKAVFAFVEIATAQTPVPVAIYLYGSSVRRAYRAPASDIDLLLVLPEHWPDEVIPKLLQIQTQARTAGARLDCVCVTREQLAAERIPVALDLVLPPDAEPQREARNRGMMFPLDRHDAWECGRPLFGPPAREVILPVPIELLRTSLAWVFPHLAANFKNPELMLCRATFAFIEGRLCSKPEAGQWALRLFDIRWHGLIEKALAARENGGTQAVCSPEELGDFQCACGEMIKAATGINL